MRARVSKGRYFNSDEGAEAWRQDAHQQAFTKDFRVCTNYHALEPKHDTLNHAHRIHTRAYHYTDVGDIRDVFRIRSPHTNTAGNEERVHGRGREVLLVQRSRSPPWEEHPEDLPVNTDGNSRLKKDAISKVLVSAKRHCIKKKEAVWCCVLNFFFRVWVSGKNQLESCRKTARAPAPPW